MPFPKPHPTAASKYKPQFQAPAHINVTGSYALKTAIRTFGRVTIDLVVTMPPTLFTEKDYLNNRYVHKRAFYLASIAAALKAGKRDVNLSYSLLNGNHLHPVILVQPNHDDDDNDFSRSRCDIRIMVALSTLR